MKKILRKKSTFCLLCYNEKTFDKKRYYMQFSLVNPWWYPKKSAVCNGDITLWGWLFFYIGCDTKMLKRG